ANIRPYVTFAKRHNFPFILSAGIAGGDLQLEECLKKVDEIAQEEGMKLNIAVVHTELDREYLRRKVREGVEIKSVVEHPRIPKLLTEEAIDQTVHVVGQIGAEPLVDILKKGGVDGIITGRALDVGLYMAPVLFHGYPYATAAHFGKIVECAGLAFEPAEPYQFAFGVVRPDHFMVRPMNPRYKATVRSIAGHTFYERRNPWREENPGGYLDLTSAKYEQQDGWVKCWGAKWGETPYAVKMEGAGRLGYRALTVMGVNDPVMLPQLDAIIAKAEADVLATKNFAHLEKGKDFRLIWRQYGKSGVMGEMQGPLAQQPQEIGLVLEVVAKTPELADHLSYDLFLKVYIGDYPGRTTTSGNVSLPYNPGIPAGEVYTFTVWHLLPLSNPAEPFRTEVLEFPRRKKA
ncbi:MAG: acyclic terpene utilization AtuA family protein, partial [Chloroflexi bacterium]|nr:acyclic terpene utilization AtuA family protein [Chloroflexota bacterium]